MINYTPIAPDDFTYKNNLICGSRLQNHKEIASLNLLQYISKSQNISEQREKKVISKIRDQRFILDSSFNNTPPRKYIEHVWNPKLLKLHLDARYARWFCSIGEDNKPIIESCVFLKITYKDINGEKLKYQNQEIACSRMTLGYHKDSKGISNIFHLCLDTLDRYQSLTNPNHRTHIDYPQRELRVPAHVIAYPSPENESLCFYPLNLYGKKRYLSDQVITDFQNKLNTSLKIISTCKGLPSQPKLFILA